MSIKLKNFHIILILMILSVKYSLYASAEEQSILSIPEVKKIAELWIDSGYGINKLSEDFVSENKCQIDGNSKACLFGFAEGVSSLNLNWQLLLKKQLKTNQKIIFQNSDLAIIENKEPLKLTMITAAEKKAKNKKKIIDRINLYSNTALNQSSLDSLMEFIKIQVSSNQLLDSAFTYSFLNAYKKSEDPFAFILPISYFKKQLLSDSNTTTNLGFTVEVINKNLTVTKIRPNSGAFWAGLKNFDIIQKIDGTPVNELTTEKISKVISSKYTKFSILRDKQNKELEISTAPEEQKKINFSLIEWNSKRITYIQLSTFVDDGKICNQFKTKIEKMITDDQTEGVVLDLRGNSGGSISLAECIVSYFLGANKLVFINKSIHLNFENPSFTLQSDVVNLKIPLVILLNGESASASELMAGALRDHQRAWNVGELTFGKGSVSRPKFFKNNSQLVEYYTSHLFYQPNNTTNELVGIIPDFEVSRNIKNLPEDVYMRNFDLNPFLNLKRNEASPPPRSNEIKQIKACVDENKIKNLNNKNIGTSLNPDYQKLYALEVLRCEIEGTK